MYENTLTHDRICSELIKEDPSFADLVEQFVSGLGSRIHKMERALQTSDFDTLRVAAHQLKGSGGGYGYPILTERGASLERLAQAQDQEGCDEAVEELKSICQRVVPGPH